MSSSLSKNIIQHQPNEAFSSRHIGPKAGDLTTMLKRTSVKNIDELISQTIPEDIRLTKELDLEDAVSEYAFLRDLKSIAAKNKCYKTYIGQGYYSAITPGVILRNIFENPGWYTQYTPYQAEISQGRLEALLNFQTMINDLTGMEISNASLLDEGTAAAEAMGLSFRQANKRSKDARKKYFVDEHCFVQTLDVLKSRAAPMSIELVIGDAQTAEFDDSYFGCLVQYPNAQGAIVAPTAIIEKAHANNMLATVVADLLSLAQLKSPGEMDADIVVGSAQRFGIPLGYGGPHPAYFATRESFARNMPGRVIGVSIDAHNNPAYRMSLQTREQHIKRAKATSNICTAQALLAIMAGMYAVYHGQNGIKIISQRITHCTARLANALRNGNYKLASDTFFDTLYISPVNGKTKTREEILDAAEKNEINLCISNNDAIGLSIDETTSDDDLALLATIFGVSLASIDTDIENPIPAALVRQSAFLSNPVFNQHHSETEMLRYIKRLEQKDLSLTTSMISLGSCTMKLNATTQMLPVTWPEFSHIHPFAPLNQAQGYAQVIKELENQLATITGFHGVSLQPNSGAQGEYAGLMAIRAYHIDRADSQRRHVLIPSSAHGTNPASAAMCGMDIVVVKCDELGNIDTEDLKNKAEKYSATLSALMITYPSTHGVFEEGIKEICQLIHQHGGQVYMDGANMNAQVGLTNPGSIGADVCHLNLHKTFAIPHGGGGPGMGPICVAKQLTPYLPTHPLVKTGGEKSMPAIASAPWSSASVLLISYAYIRLLGKQGLTDATRYAILNANYMKDRLKEHYPLLYQGKNGRVAHEMILDMRSFKQSAGIEVTDVAKRLMDYGYHAPTVSWPVAGTMMIEPTESESLHELDQFCDALIAIRQEIRDIEEGKADREDNTLKNAPHTVQTVMVNDWTHGYSRETAAFPSAFTKANKFWPSVGRINDLHGDRNLICSCPSPSDYEAQ